MYVWEPEGSGQIIVEYTDGSLIRKYIYGPGMDHPVAMIAVDGETETWYYYYSDAQGSIRLMTNAGGYVVESYTGACPERSRGNVYGKPYVMTSAGTDNNWLTEDVSTQNYSSIGNPYLFTGRRWYHGMNLYYYRFRDYAPVLGRFLQTDPAGYVDTLNLYAYCGNNPVNWIDPWGLCSKMEGAAEEQLFEDLAAELSTGMTLDDIAKFAHKSQGTGKYKGAKEQKGEKGRRRDKQKYKDKKRNPEKGWKPNKRTVAIGAGVGTGVIVCYAVGHVADWATAGPSGVETALYGSFLAAIFCGGASSADTLGGGSESYYPYNDPSDINTDDPYTNFYP